MAENVKCRNNVLPEPIYGLPWVETFPILDADGDLVTGAAGLDSEVSKNGDTFADCANEAAEIATSSGTYALALTAAEMSAEVVTIIVKTSTTGAKTTTITRKPRRLPVVRSGTVGADGITGTTVKLDSSASAIDDFYNGCVIYTSDGDARIITNYDGATKLVTVGAAWETNPTASTSTYLIYQTDTACNVVADIATEADISALVPRIKKNTAQTIIFAMKDATTGALAAGKTVAGYYILDSGSRTTMGAIITEVSGGWYRAALTQAITNGDAFGYDFTATGCHPVTLSGRTTA